MAHVLHHSSQLDGEIQGGQCLGAKKSNLLFENIKFEKTNANKNDRKQQLRGAWARPRPHGVQKHDTVKNLVRHGR